MRQSPARSCGGGSLDAGVNEMIRLILPLPPSVNASHRNVRVDLRIKTRAAQDYMVEAAWLAKVWTQKTGWTIPAKGQKVLMRTWTFWPDKRRRDTHNRIKILADALEGVLYEDDRYVLVREQDYTVDRERPRIEIEMEVMADG